MGTARFRYFGFSAFIILSCVFYVLQKDCMQFDLWQHLACGRQMVETRTLIYQDTFSHTIEGQPFIDQNWLAQVIFYLVYRLANEKVLIFAVGCGYALAFVAITYCAVRRSNHLVASALAGALTVFMSLENVGIRPQVFSVLFFSLELLVLWTLPMRWRPLA